MNDEEELRRRLAAMDVPPSRLEADALVSAGRRRSFRRRSWQAAASVALATGALVVVPAVVIDRRAEPLPPAHATGPGRAPASTSGGSAQLSGSAQPSGAAPISTPAQASDATRTTGPARRGSCAGSGLPTPAGAAEAAAVAVDPTGRYIVGHSVVGQNFRPILWTGGVPRALPSQAPSMELTAVNAAGVVAGLASGPGLEYVFRYENGRYTRMRTPPGRWHVYPYPAMNAAGDIVINAEPQGNSGGEGSIVLFWKAGATTAVRLPLPERVNVHAITDDGTILGGTYPDGSAVAAYAWDADGNGRRLDLPAGQTGAVYAARGDWATGGLWPAQTSALWNLRTGAVTRLATDGPGDAVNASGVVVAAGTVLRDGAVAGLAAPAGQRAVAAAVSDTGLVVGHTRHADGSPAGPRVWQC